MTLCSDAWSSLHSVCSQKSANPGVDHRGDRTDGSAATDLLERQYADRQDKSNLDQEISWKPLLGCRWSIGDPYHFDSFRFCGCACAPEAIYCDTHKNMAFAPNRERTFIPGRAVPLSATKVS
ncbi:MAG: GcrA family cell cycle regulator [Methylocystis sp.]|uniref:GcrA family cell cycle regulator n=1 Tax=Methylocystis sp. TaxID=1911079 RepID=UPI003D0FF5F7